MSSEKNASDFIRSQPTNMTAPEVVDAGKNAGFDFSASLVYAVRGRMKKGTGPAPTGARREVSSGAGVRRTSASSAGAGRLDAEIAALVEEFVKEMTVLVRRAALDSVRQALGERR